MVHSNNENDIPRVDLGLAGESQIVREPVLDQRQLVPCLAKAFLSCQIRGTQWRRRPRGNRVVLIEIFDLIEPGLQIQEALRNLFSGSSSS